MLFGFDFLVFSAPVRNICGGRKKGVHPEKSPSIAIPGSFAVATPVVTQRVFFHQETPAVVLLSRTVAPGASYNHFVGATTERIMNQTLTRRLFQETGGWIAINPGRIGNRGIDGLFIKVDQQGIPQDILVGEAKFGTSQLGRTQAGVQMSDSWIKSRLQQSANAYESLERQFERGQAKPASGRAAIQARRQGKTFTIPLEDRSGTRIVAEVWQEGNELRYFSRDKTIPTQRIRQQISRIRRYLSEASQGKIRVRKSVFRYSVSEGKYVFKIYSVTDSDKLVLERTLEFLPDKLPHDFKRALRRAVVEELLSRGFSKEEARRTAQELLDNPEMLSQLKDGSRQWISPTARTTLYVGLASGGLAAALDLLSQAIQSEQIDYARTLKMGGLGFASGATGYLVTTGVDEALRRSTLGISLGSVTRTAWASAAGGAAASVVFAYGTWLLGHSTLDEAHEAATVGLLASGVSAITVSAAWWAVATFGTASTGTAISSLSGAAATNAILAWFGGGSLAAGGGGVALGATVITGIGAVAVLAVFGGYAWWKYSKDAKERRVISQLDLKWNREHLQERLQRLHRQAVFGFH